MDGQQHLAAADAALAKANEQSGPRGDVEQFNKYMRLHEAHLAMASFELEVAKTVAYGLLIPRVSHESEPEQIKTLADNTDRWIAAITDGGAR